MTPPIVSAFCAALQAAGGYRSGGIVTPVRARPPRPAVLFM